MANNSFNTIGYLQSKVIKTPLHLNTEWNTAVNNCLDCADLYALCQSKGTTDDEDVLMSFLTE